MRYRKLGRTGFEVSEIGYGAWGISGAQWIGASDEESLAALRLAIDCGLNFIDTALAYGEGHSEQLVGQAVREAGRKIYVATKVPPKNRLWPARPDIGIEQVFPEHHIIACTEQSLRNLGLDVIDLLQLHVWNPDFTDRDEWRTAFDKLKRTGKVHAAGISLSEHKPDDGLRAIHSGSVDTVQVIYNIFDQTPEQNLFPECIRHNVGVLARVPLDEGGLTGTITAGTTFSQGDFRNYYFRGDRKQRVADRIAALDRDLPAGNRSLPELALRFCLSHPAVSTVIPGMRQRRNVEANCRASDAGPLPPDVLAILRRHVWNRNFYD